MRRIILASVVTLVLFGLAAQAQTTPPTPGPELKKLGVFVGKWTGEGKFETTPFSKGGAAKSTMACRWFAGGFQLVCDSEDSGPMGVVKGMGIYGYKTEKKQYFSFGIDSMGFGGPGTVKVAGNDWTFEASDAMGGKTYWFRTVVTFASPSEMTFKSDYSEDGKNWKPAAEGKLTRK